MASGIVYKPVQFRETVSAYDADNFILKVEYLKDIPRFEVRQLAEKIAQRNNAVLRERCKELGLTYYAPKEVKPRPKKNSKQHKVDITGIELPAYEVGAEIQGSATGKIRARVVCGDDVHYSQYFTYKDEAIKAAYQLNMILYGTADNWFKKIEAVNKRYREKMEKAVFNRPRFKGAF